MEGIYDALEPFTEKYSKIWRLVVYTCAVLAGYNENKDDFNLIHQFPADPKLKTMSLLLQDLQKVNESGAPSFTRDVINNDIAEIIFTGDDEALEKYKIRHKFYPFNGKTTDEISLQLSSQYVSEETKILYSNFEAIFTEIEINDEKFYQKKYKEQRQIVDEIVQKWKDEILKSEPIAIDFGNLGGSGSQNQNQNQNGDNAGNQTGDQNAGTNQNNDGNPPAVTE